MQNENRVFLEKFYAFLSQGKAQDAMNLCPEEMTFQVPGKSNLAGKFTKQNFTQNYWNMQMELSGGTYKLEVHDLMASDIHATALVSIKVTRGDKTTELRAVHVWRFGNGKPLAWYEYPRDLYAFDNLWA